MAENGSAGAEPQAPQQDAAMIQIAGQYVKDLSFEAPHAPAIFDKLREQPPEVNMNLDVTAERLPGDDVFEVGLNVNVQAKVGDDVGFVLELAYHGVFKLNVPKEHMEPVLLIECPRMLFPFARNIVCDTTRDGGFVPLMLQPVDFAQLYRQKLEQRQAELKAAANAEPAGQA